MQRIADFVSAAISNYHIDSSTIQRVQACLNIKMKVDGWILLILSNRECVLLKSNNGEFMNQGFVVNDHCGEQIVVDGYNYLLILEIEILKLYYFVGCFPK